ncbi:hypothetical protein [Salinarimonas chemoclinalis]|uniref:hypothetical protein n=1 Tax=Salinarimonas chemoclinalis TaxID=3241599 RepID=UPI003558F033
MTWANFLEAQNVMTIAIVLVLAIGTFAYFLRRKSNRRAASNAFSGDPSRSALARKAEQGSHDPVDRTGDPAGPPKR